VNEIRSTIVSPPATPLVNIEPPDGRRFEYHVVRL
jgi:8-oxo-dGTP pyrophosphatase MutT (NUDIX family)